ncbi:MAG: hypothetical protein PHD15_04565 [Clostridia bacterium]|nr:hypothetical protein [Clostridia bacterium]MDD4387013.1 hypothetical protein [Clostridia bacterium]
MVHVVYCDNKEKVLEKILNGSKTMIIRGASGRKIPHSRVFNNEELYFIEKGSGLISTKAIVKYVQNFIKLSDEEITEIIEKNNLKLNLSEKQKERWHKKCLCLIEFDKVEKINPMKLNHQSNMDDWLIIEKIEDVVVGTSIKYNYDNSKMTANKEE